jgi:hypothetical protein
MSEECVEAQLVKAETELAHLRQLLLVSQNMYTVVISTLAKHEWLASVPEMANTLNAANELAEILIKFPEKMRFAQQKGDEHGNSSNTDQAEPGQGSGDQATT